MNKVTRENNFCRLKNHSGLLIFILIGNLLFPMKYVFSEVKASFEQGTKGIVIENETIRMKVDPERGGAIISFIHKVSGRDIILQDRKYMGLFMDHMWGQNWPGELLEVPYEVELIKEGPKEAVVRTWRKMSGKWGGVEQKVFYGLIVEKTYCIRSGIDAVFCHILVKNPENSGKLPCYWLQNVFFIGGDYDAREDVFYRPSTRGVRESFQGGREDDFMRDPYAGWSAAVDRKKEEGLLFLMDYNDLDMLYNCGGNTTLEWMYDKIPLPREKSWEAEVTLIPLEKIKRISHGSRRFICETNLERKGDELKITCGLRGSMGEIQNFRLYGEIIGVLDSRKQVLPSMEFGTLTRTVKTITQTVKVDSTDPLVIFFTGEGQVGKETFSETFFDFFSGDYGYGDNIQQDMLTPLYKANKPQKKQTLMRPENITKKQDKKLQVFILRGMYLEKYKIEESLRSIFPEGNLESSIEINSGNYSPGYAGPRLTDFPFDYDILMSQDVIVIGNVNIQCLGPLGLQILRDYVTHGGSLLFFGGKSSYGSGGIADSGIEDLFPVEVGKTFFDMVAEEKSEIVFGEEDTLTAGLNLGSKPLTPYIHRMKVKKSAKVLLKTKGNNPFLVVQEVEGGGRIVCFLGAPYGEETKGNAPIFYIWDEWEKLLIRIFRWLGRLK